MDTKRLRQRVLDLAIHGKLVPQNPQDEPASELLKRIAAEKERLVKEGKIKKSKKKDNEDIDEVPFEVPQGWVWTSVDEIFIVTSGQDYDPSKYNDSQKGIPYIIGASNFLNGQIIENRWTEHPSVFAQRGDVLLVCKGAGVGKLAICNIETAHIARQVQSIRDVTGLCNINFILYTIQVQIERIISQANGLIPGLKREVILGTKIPLPPLAEQHRIVSEVEKYFSLIDILEESENDLQQSIQKAKSKILDLAIKGKLVEKTGEWEEKKLGDIGKWQAGATPSRANKSYYGGNIPWLKTGDLNDGFITEIPEYITEKALEETSVKLNPEGSVLVAMYGATIGKVGILTFPATTNQACCACINCSIDKMYLFYFLLANKEYFIRLGGGGAQPNISKEKIVNTPISVPPLAEQHQIVAKIEEIFTQLDNIAEALK